MRLDLEKLFQYYPPQGNQQERYNKINAAALAFATVIQENTEECAEQTLAIRDVQRARMMGNAAVALGDASVANVQQAGS